jgi:hypothetical protein
MYIRKKKFVSKGKTYFRYQLVESVSTPKGPRQQIVCPLGDLTPRSREEWLAWAQRLEQALMEYESPPRKRSPGARKPP